MGINPTPTNHRSFTFDGKSTREFGVYITGEGVFNAPERAVEMISIPGRDGEYALDQGHFNNIEVTYRAGIVSYSTTDFAEAISNFRNWLASRKGYCRLTDEYNPDEYRMAVFKNVITVEHEGLETGEFDVVFNCKPQRWLTEGETTITIGEWGETETYSGEIASFEATDSDAVKALTADIEPIQDLNGYDAPWVGGAGKNKLQTTATSTTINTCVFTVNADGTVNVNGTPTADSTKYISLTNIPSGNYYFSGCPSGGGISKYDVFIWDNTVGARAKRWDGTTDSVTDYGTSNNNEVKIVEGHTYSFNMRIRNGYNAQNLVFKPMIRPSTETDGTWQPYENICPISGHDAVVVSVVGVNVWDEEWVLGAHYTASGAYNPNYTDRICSKNYIPVCPSTTYYMRNGQNITNGVSIVCYDEDKNLLGWFYNKGNATFTTQSDCHYICFDMPTTYGTTYNNDISINYPSTDHDYHAYNGNTYTTTLPSTTYGGGHEFVSGVLTTTTICRSGSSFYKTDITSIGNNGTNTRFWLYSGSSTLKKHGEMLCNLLPSITTNKAQVWTNYTVGVYDDPSSNQGYPASIGICMPTSLIGTTQDSIYNYLQTDALELTYELATPQTYQLTGQQVALLLGENNIFADSGNVTVEVGQNPSVLINTTQFDSEPLLAVDGYGTIGFNGFEIEINNEVMGDVIVAEADDVYRPTARTITIQADLLNTSDTFVVNAEFRIQHTKTSSNQVTSITLGTATGCSAVYSRPNTVNVVMDSATFTKGTSATATCSIAYSAVTTNTGTVSCTQTCTVTYNGTDTLTFSTSGTNITNTKRTARHGVIYGDSTISVLGNPTYIDCEIGECYMIKNSEIISLNQYIDLGSDLPKLSSGMNTFAFDNTVTELKVTPRWWKV